jgi:transposase
VRECDAAIERPFQAILPVWDDDWPPLDRQDKALSHRKNAPAYDARSRLYQLTGVDVVAIPGLHASTVQTMMAELGLARGKWPHEKAFWAWRGLAPRPEIAGGNVWRRSTRKTRHRAGQALRFAAPAAGRSQSGLGACSRRMRARLGPPAAIVATAHKIARLIDHLRTQRTSCHDLRAEAYRQRSRTREIAARRKKGGMTRPDASREPGMSC